MSNDNPTEEATRLVERIRDTHREHGGTGFFDGGISWCSACYMNWPCTPIHAADALSAALVREQTAKVWEEVAKELHQSIQAIMSIGSRSGTNINSWNDAFGIVDELQARGLYPQLRIRPPLPNPRSPE